MNYQDLIAQHATALEMSVGVLDLPAEAVPALEAHAAKMLGCSISDRRIRVIWEDARRKARGIGRGSAKLLPDATVTQLSNIYGLPAKLVTTYLSAGTAVLALAQGPNPLERRETEEILEQLACQGALLEDTGESDALDNDCDEDEDE
jgi:hypothetical protein